MNGADVPLTGVCRVRVCACDGREWRAGGRLNMLPSEVAVPRASRQVMLCFLTLLCSHLFFFTAVHFHPVDLQRPQSGTFVN